MKNPILKFQEELSISKKNAITRIILFFVLSTCIIALISITFLTFPYHTDYPVFQTTVPTGHYEVVIKINEQGIELNEKQFYKRLLSKDTIFVSVNERGTAIFMINDNKSSFYYKKETDNTYFYYKLKKVSIKDNAFLVIERERDLTSMIVFGIIMPICLFICFLFLTFFTQTKQIGSRIDVEGTLMYQYNYVWFSHCLWY